MNLISICRKMVINGAHRTSVWTPNSKLEDGQFCKIGRGGRNNEPSDVDALERHSREGIAQAERKDRTSEQSGKHECK
jgi:hypothetical protein